MVPCEMPRRAGIETGFLQVLMGGGFEKAARSRGDGAKKKGGLRLASEGR
jgi:hypothetical protein